MKDNYPLVSVVVITYNSQNFITETLDSVELQTYNNIELIISDDHSTDGTVSYIKSWLKEKSDRFVRVALVESPINTGVAPNINRGIKKATGEWIKLLSGDDKLLTNSITDYVDFINDNPQCNICFGKLHFYGEDAEYIKHVKEDYNHRYYPYIKANYRAQWRKIQERLFVPGPGLFYKKDLWNKVGGFDERFPFADEYPFTYNVLESGERIFFLDKEVYGYHIRKGSLCRENGLINIKVFEDKFNYIKEVLIGKSVRHGFIFTLVHVLIKYYRAYLVYYKKPLFIRRCSVILYLFSPYSYPIIFKKLIHRIFR